MLPYERVYNFSSGPATLPVPVLERIRDEMLNHGGSGMSVLEMSHRGGPYDAIHESAKDDLRTLLSIPEEYQILFLPGGASLQFTMVAKSFGQGGYVVTGAWGVKAREAAAIEGEPRTLFEDERRVPKPDELSLEGDYIHITTNETIGGVQWKADPTFDRPLVADMSSDFASRPLDVSKYGLIYAGAQKNAGPAGVTIVIVRNDLLERVPKGLPPMLNYRVQAKNDSRYNTPPTFPIYVVGLVARHLIEMGGLEAVAERNEIKAGILYRAIDESGGFYRGHAETDSRSAMNVVFTLPDEARTKAFVQEAAVQGLEGLGGHRSVGGVRASVYNAFPETGCALLADFMRDFARRNG